MITLYIHTYAAVCWKKKQLHSTFHSIYFFFARSPLLNRNDSCQLHVFISSSSSKRATLAIADYSCEWFHARCSRNEWFGALCSTFICKKSEKNDGDNLLFDYSLIQYFFARSLSFALCCCCLGVICSVCYFCRIFSLYFCVVYANGSIFISETLAHGFPIWIFHVKMWGQYELWAWFNSRPMLAATTHCQAKPKTQHHQLNVMWQNGCFFVRCMYYILSLAPICADCFFPVAIPISFHFNFFLACLCLARFVRCFWYVCIYTMLLKLFRFLYEFGRTTTMSKKNAKTRNKRGKIE